MARAASDACRCWSVATIQWRRPAAAKRSRAAHPNGPLAPGTVPIGKLTMTRSGAGTWPVRRCSGSHARRAWRLGPSASMRMPRVFRHGPCTDPAPASSIFACPTWNDVWPRVARTTLLCGASCESGVSQAAPGRCIAGWARGGRHRPGPAHMRAATGRWTKGNQLGPRSPVLVLPTVPQLAWLLVQPTTSPGITDMAMAARVEQDEQAAAVVQLARRFTALVRACGVASWRDGHAPADPIAELDAWLVKARASRAPATATFAAWLEADGAAVRAVLTLLEQRPGQRPDQPHQAPETTKLRSGRFRPAATASSGDGMIHAKCGRATEPG